jgi:hypothetical protein
MRAVNDWSFGWVLFFIFAFFHVDFTRSYPTDAAAIGLACTVAKQGVAPQASHQKGLTPLVEVGEMAQEMFFPTRRRCVPIVVF